MATTRRGFVQSAGLGLAAHSLAAGAGTLPRRPLGRTGLEVSVLGLGGARIGALDDGQTAYRVIRRCHELGMNYFDTAAAGAYGLSQARYGKALQELRGEIVLATKTRHRTWVQAEIDMNQSLQRLKTDHIDLYQVHNVMDDEDIDAIFAPRGLMEMIEKAKRDGKVRFVGVTGHADPGVMNRVLERYEFDTVLIPLSVTDGAAEAAKSFEKTTLPLARKQGVGVIALTTVGLGRIMEKGIATLGEAVSYIQALPVSTAIMGCDTVEQVEQDVRALLAAKPLDKAGAERLRRRASRFELARLEPWKQPANPVTGARPYTAC